jgi:type IV pilus assembly protein PilY1
LAGLRGGGPYYFALDISDPLDPQFLWQFTRSDMGPAMGRPGIGQVLVNIEGVLQERSVAIFGGGGGTLAAVPRGRGWGGCSVPPGALQARFPASASGRTTRNCWINNLGMSFYVVDVATGEVIRSFGPDILAAPMTGGVSLFSGDTGMIANRAYTTDAAGVLWRLDMSSTNPANWAMAPVHDLYWSDGPGDGADSQEPPIVSVDNSGNVVVVVGTGNMDDLEGQELYRVVSVTDRIVYSSTGFTYNPTLNWEIRLQPGEQVTGPMVLFDSKVYFNTFLSTDSTTDLCAYGGSRMWGVHYLETSTSTPPVGYTSTTGVAFPKPMLEETPGSGVFNQFYSDMAPNTIAVGVNVATAPTCLAGETTTDPYLGTRYLVTESSPATFRLVSQVSGAGSTVPGRTSVGTVSIGLPPLESYTRILSYAANADY